jgi:hypothetical protein
MFDLDQFIDDCRVALAADKSHKSVREIVARAVSDPARSRSRHARVAPGSRGNPDGPEGLPPVCD